MKPEPPKSINPIFAWLLARLRERSTWLGLTLIAAAIAAPRLGIAYADMKDGALVLFGLASLGGGLAAHRERA